MAALSIFPPEGPAVGCANPIYPTGDIDFRSGSLLTFEVLEGDSSSLKRLIGKIEQFGLQSRVFCGELISLEACETTVDAFAMLGKPVMRGVLRIH